jgi:WD40 repeat protein
MLMSEADKPTTLSDVRSDRGDSAPAPSTLPEVRQDTYRLGREVARGGMGRVIEAHDLRVGRQVALKELLVESSQNAARFEREARVTARLQHPAIVPIYEIGRWPDGAPFYAMRMVEGRTLRTCLAEVKTLADRLALLPSIISAAEAIAYAHSHGVIHRDLTPANIMVGNFGETVVIDWGLAKVLGADDEPDAGPYRQQSDGLTLVGSVMGTPAYMPPEQAAGEPVDERGDVYSLGAILYHLLVGHAPFRGESPDAILTKVRTVVPEPIRVPEVPADLTSIVDKAMSRDPKHRYANASALVAELVRFRSGQLVGAHSYSRADLVRRWVREHRLAVFASAAAFGALVIMGTIAIVGIIRERDRADAERAVVLEQRRSMLVDQAARELDIGHASRALPYLVEALREGADTPALRVLIAEAARPLDREIWTHRDFGGGLTGIEWADDGRFVATGMDGTQVVFSSEGRPLQQATFSVDTTQRWVRSNPSFSRQGNRVIAASSKDGTNLWNLETGATYKLVHDLAAHPASFDPAGNFVLAGRVARIWDASTGALLRTLGKAACTTWLTDTKILFIDMTGTLAVYDWKSNAAPVVVARTGPSEYCRMDVGIEGTRVVIQSDTGYVELWNTTTWNRISQLAGTDARRRRGIVALSAKYAAVPLADRVGLWALETGTLVREFPSAAKERGFVALDRAETRIVIGSGIERDNYIWAFDEHRLELTYEAPTTSPKAPHSTALSIDAKFSPDGNRLLVATGDRMAMLRMDHAPFIDAFKLNSWTAQFSPDRSLLAAGGPQGTLQIFDAATKRVLAKSEADEFWTATWDREGKHLLVSGFNGRLELVDRELRQLRRFVGHEPTAIINQTEWSPTSDRFVSASDDRTAKVWASTTGTVLQTLVHPHRVLAVSWSPDGRHIITGCWDGMIRVWDATSGEKLQEFGDDLLRFLDVRVSPDGTRVAATTHSGFVGVWDLASRRRVGGLHGHTASVPQVAWSPDGALLATVGIDSTLRIWDSTTSRQLASRAHEGAEVLGVSWIDNTRVVVAATKVYLWSVERDARSLPELEALVQRTPWRLVEGRLELAR